MCLCRCALRGLCTLALSNEQQAAAGTGTGKSTGMGGSGSVNVTLVVLGPMPREVKLRRVDSQHANALALYDAAGSPPYPNASMLAALQAASQVVAVPVSPATAGAARATASSVEQAPHGWEVELEMEEFSVVSLAFEVEM